MLSKEQLVNECLKALVDPTRVMILKYLKETGEKNRTEIIGHLASSGLEIVPMTVTHHMTKLINTGVVRTRSVSNFKYWELEPEMRDMVDDVLRLRAKLDQYFTGKTPA